MLWTWDENKNRINTQKHGLSFETAQRVFDDPLSAHRPDPQEGEERWHTIGRIGGVVIVAHPSARNPWCRGPHYQRPEGDGARKDSL